MGAPKYLKQLLTNIKQVINSNTITAGNLNTPPILMHRSSREKINKEIVVLNHTLGKIYLTHIYRILSPKTAEKHYFQVTLNLSQDIHILGHERNINKFQKFEIISV